MKKPSAGLALFGTLVVGAAILGTRATQKGMDQWYEGLKKPPFQPPKAAFPVAWTALYGMIALAGSRIWLAPWSAERTKALAAWGAQLGFNAAWSELFFRHRRPDLAFVDMSLLMASMGAFYVTARKVDRSASLLFVPYLGWVAFAALLNEEIVRLNPTFGGVVAPPQTETHYEGSRILAHA